jgi:ABC-type sugar transport system ATPase subunit
MSYRGGAVPHFTVERNIGLVPTLENWPEAKITARIHELLELVGLNPEIFAAIPTHELSGGQRQRVGVGDLRLTRRYCCWMNHLALWIQYPLRDSRNSEDCINDWARR